MADARWISTDTRSPSPRVPAHRRLLRSRGRHSRTRLWLAPMPVRVPPGEARFNLRRSECIRPFSLRVRRLCGYPQGMGALWAEQMVLRGAGAEMPRPTHPEAKPVSKGVLVSGSHVALHVAACLRQTRPPTTRASSTCSAHTRPTRVHLSHRHGERTHRVQTSHKLRQNLDRNLTPSTDRTTFDACASSSIQRDSLSGRQVAARHHLLPRFIERSPHAELDIEQLTLLDPKAGLHRPAVHSDVPPTPTRIAWRRLLARVFSVELTRCPLCEGPLKIIEAVVDPARIAMLLDQRREMQAREARAAAGQTGRDAADVGRNFDDAGTRSQPRLRESGCGTRGPPHHRSSAMEQMSSLSCSSLASHAVRADKVETGTRREKPRPACRRCFDSVPRPRRENPKRGPKRYLGAALPVALGVLASPLSRHARRRTGPTSQFAYATPLRVLRHHSCQLRAAAPRLSSLRMPNSPDDDTHVHGPGCNHGHGHDHPSVEPARRAVRPGRNEPCWCGGGKKYKKCHLLTDEAAAR